MGSARYWKILYRRAVCRRAGAALRIAFRQSACAGGYNRRTANCRRQEYLLPAEEYRAGGAVLSVFGRAERLLAGGAEGIL